MDVVRRIRPGRFGVIMPLLMAIGSTATGQDGGGTPSPQRGDNPPSGPGTAVPMPGTPGPSGATPPGSDPGRPATPTQPPPSGAADSGPGAALSSGLGGTASGAASAFGMLGDQSPILVHRAASIPTVPPPFPPNNPPTPPDPRKASSLTAAVRGIKIAENQSPRPQDRLFYSFNFYSNLNDAVNTRLDSPVGSLRAYRHILGLEKTFDDGRASIGFRLPIDTLTANSRIQGNFARAGGTSTSAGDLGLFAKFLVREDQETGSLISAGLALTAPTGPDRFAGASYLQSLHTTRIQPFAGYIYNRGRFYLHGFTALEFPTNPTDVTLAYNDAGIGYFLLRDPDPSRWLTAVAPTFEVHVNTPLNHRGAFDPTDLAGTSNVVNFTYGLNLEFARRSVLTFGLVSPVSSPKPFDLEAIILLNVKFGATRRSRLALPIIGG